MVKGDKETQKQKVISFRVSEDAFACLNKLRGKLTWKDFVLCAILATEETPDRSTIRPIEEELGTAPDEEPGDSQS